MANLYNSQISSSVYGAYSSVPYGSFILTIGAHKYISDDLDVSRPTTTIERNNEVGEQHGLVIIPRPKTGTATLQMPSSSIAPALGSTFSVTTSGSAAETFTISEVGQTYSSGADVKVRITFISTPV